MEKEDELGDFFAEIQQVEENIDEYKQNYIDDTDNQPSKQARIEVTTTSEPVVLNEVISKPAEINKNSNQLLPQYPIFTYEAINQSEGSVVGTGSGSTNTTSHHTPAFIPRQNKKFVRKAGGDVWVDDTLQEWPENDFRIFVGDLGKEVTTEMLSKHFQIFPSFAKAKVIVGKSDSKARGYGFVSFLDPNDCIRAIREMNGKYLGTR